MTLNIKNSEVDRLARELASRRGKGITEAIMVALREQLAREKQRDRGPGLAKQLLEIGKRSASLPILDNRTEDEILGYDEHGIPQE